MDEQALVAYVKELQGTETQAHYAETLGCSPAYLSDFYAGKRSAGPTLLKALNLKKCVSYKKWRVEDEPANR